MSQVKYEKHGLERREIIYQYVRKKGRGWLAIKDIANELGFTYSIAYHFITKMIKEGLFMAEKGLINRKKSIFIRLEDEYAEGLPEIETVALPIHLPTTVSHIRVIRLLDKPLSKPPESKKKTQTHIGSSMNLIW